MRQKLVALAVTALLTCAHCRGQAVAHPGLDAITQAQKELSAAEAATPASPPGAPHAEAAALEKLTRAQLDAQLATGDTLALAKREVALSETSGGKTYAMALATLAEVEVALGQPAESRPHAEHAFQIAQKEFPQSPEFGPIADTMGTSCLELGDFPCALKAQSTAVESMRKTRGGADIELATTLQNLANTKMHLGDTPGAEAAVEESDRIAQQLISDRGSAPQDPRMGIVENNIGAFYAYTAQPGKAIPHLTLALAMITDAFSTDNVQAAFTTSNLADMYSRTGQFALSWKSYEQAMPEYRRWLGTAHSITSNAEAAYGRSLAAGGDLPNALKLSLDAEQQGRESFILSVRTLPERQALAFDRTRAHGIDVALSVLVRHPELPPANVYREMIRSRALVAEEMAWRQKNLNRNNDPQVARLLKDLDEARSSVLALEQEQPGKPTDPQALAQATDAMEHAERALAERSAIFRADQRSTAVNLEDLQHSLPKHSVLISYVRYGHYAVEATDPKAEGVPSYLAFVFHPETNRIRVFDLGPEKPINTLITQARKTVDTEMNAGGLGAIRNERVFRQAAGSLRAKIWDPLRPELTGAKLVLIVPDGLLNLIPFGAMPDGQGYLVEHSPVIHTLSSERDLVPGESAPGKSGLFAIGSPEFDLARNAAPTGSSPVVRGAVSSDPLRNVSLSCEEFNKVEFHPLPGTAAEIDDIAAEWKRWNTREPEMLSTGTNATRDSFLRQAVQYRVVHIATHAFLLSQSCGDGNPLLHSGLVFAGANSNREASLLTAQQIASLDLAGLDWAVLSACNTGIGALHDGEGVLGLQRAFRVAGARSVIMTLWPVDDDVTRLFMHELYTERLERHSSTANAVWHSSQTLLLQRRAAGKSTHPWYWAGFVGSGGWE